MREIALFAEDFGHEIVLQTLVQRLAIQFGVPVNIQPRSVRGGHPRMLAELKQFVRDLIRGRQYPPDLLIVARDANCKGHAERKQEIERASGQFAGQVVCAIPDPYLERWLLLDSGAFKTALGKGCRAPGRKCERERYKRQLLEAVRDAGLRPSLRGLGRVDVFIGS